MCIRDSLLIDRIKLGEPDESGRRKPVIKEGSDFEIKADMVIKALGFDPEIYPIYLMQKNYKLLNGELSKQILIQCKQI